MRCLRDETRYDLKQRDDDDTQQPMSTQMNMTALLNAHDDVVVGWSTTFSSLSLVIVVISRPQNYSLSSTTLLHVHQLNPLSSSNLAIISSSLSRGSTYKLI